MNPVNIDGLHTGTYYISIIEDGKVTSSLPFIVQQ